MDPVFRADLLAGQTIVVTGGGSGIGRMTAHQLAGLGAHVVLVGRTAERLEQVGGELDARGLASSYVAGDIRDDDAVARVVETALVPTGRIDGLVNNAGGQYASPAAELSRRGFEAVVAVNLTGTFLVTTAVHRASMAQHGGAIVNMGMLNERGMPGMAHSGAARAGVENLTMSWATEWAVHGIRVNMVAPGWIDSSGLDTYPDEVRVLLDRVIDATPARRAGTEAEVANAITFLLSPAASFVTGVTIRIDGGAELGRATWPIPDHDAWPAPVPPADA